MPVHDPAWDMPQPNWEPQSSFESPIITPLLGPDAGTLVCVPPFNDAWLRIILGCLDQLRNPATWAAVDSADMSQVLSWVDRLKQLFSMAGPCCDISMRLESGCVLQYSKDGGSTWLDVTDWAANFPTCVSAVTIPPVPINPGGNLPNQHACNISGFLANEIIQKTMAAVVAYVGTTNEQAAFAAAMIADISFIFPITAAAAAAAYQFYQDVVTQLLGQVEAARDDPALWSLVTCAIYNAIKTTGYVTSANFGAVAANLHGMGYTPSWVDGAIGNFWSEIGLQNIQALQNVGAIDDVDCTDCGTWCYQFDFTVGTQGWAPLVVGGVPLATWVAGVGWESTNARGSAECYIVLTLPQPMTLTHLDLTFTATGAASIVGLRFHRLYSSGVQVAQYAIDPAARTSPVHSSSGPISVFADKIELALASDNPGTNIVSNYQIKGNGPNPFGLDNCTY